MELQAKVADFNARYGTWDGGELSQRVDTHEIRYVTDQFVMRADVVWIAAYYELGDDNALIWGWADGKLPTAVRAGLAHQGPRRDHRATALHAGGPIPDRTRGPRRRSGG